MLDFLKKHLFYLFLFFLLRSAFAVTQVDTSTFYYPDGIYFKAPKKTTHNIETQITVTSFDFYHQLGYVYAPKAFEFRTGFGYGINRTLFQQQFAPQFYIGFSYDCIRDIRWVFGPVFSYSLAGFTYYKAAKAKVLYQDLFVGAQLFYGKKWKVGTRLLVGSSVEQLLNSPIKTNFWAFNYSAEIGVRYAF